MIEVDADRAARTVVETCMRVAPGELIQIRGDAVAFDFIERLAFHVQRAGAHVFVKSESEANYRRRLQELPPDFLAALPPHEAGVLEKVTGVISVNASTEKRALGLPRESVAAAHKAFGAAQEILKRSDARVIVATWPTPEQAACLDIPWEEYHDLVWRAFLVDLDAVAAECARVRKAFGRGRAVRLTTAKGTDIRMSVEGRTLRIDDAIFTPEDLAGKETITNIPCGEVYMAPLETTVDGVAVFDEIFADGARIRDLVCRFERGRVVDFRSERDDVEPFRRMLEAHTGEPRVIAELGLGLNPEVRKAVGSIFLDEKIYGSAHLAIGDNYRYGGVNRSSLHFDMVMLSPTLVVDGTTIFDAGRVAV